MRVTFKCPTSGRRKCGRKSVLVAVSTFFLAMSFFLDAREKERGGRKVRGEVPEQNQREKERMKRSRRREEIANCDFFEEQMLLLSK